MTNPTATTCPKCHGAIEPGERFCRNCGTSLSGEQRARTTELDLLQEATLGDYEIVRVLGQGGNWRFMHGGYQGWPGGVPAAPGRGTPPALVLSSVCRVSSGMATS